VGRPDGRDPGLTPAGSSQLEGLAVLEQLGHQVVNLDTQPEDQPMFKHIADHFPDVRGGLEPRRASVCNAVTVTDVTPAGNVDSKAFEVAASAAGDVAAVVPHGLARTPGKDQIFLVPLTADFYVKQYVVGAVDATNVNLVMTGAVGGTAPVAARVVIKAHSIGR
jgi:hypothetical protein